MKELLFTIVGFLSLASFASQDININFNDSKEVIEAAQPDFMGWECEARAADGAGGIGQGASRAQAASIALSYCRIYSVAPYTCQVFSCYGL